MPRSSRPVAPLLHRPPHAILQPGAAQVRCPRTGVGMAVIRVMPDWLKNQIAAGEVVERPASVLKELLENSLDAGATRIDVEVVSGGIDLIRVTDNGSGMSREDAELALERHATSKCASMEELRAIATFGFRGEALPSIASISRFTLRTRTADQAVGTLVSIPDGLHRTVEDAAMAVGTEILVADLFHNVPVRRKFLKTEHTEYQACLEVVQRMALAAHRVHFELTADGRKVISAPPEASPLARVFTILGRRICDGLYECRLAGRIEVSGFISRPDLKKRASSGLFTFVNGRFVKDRVVVQAVVSGYGTLLGRGEYPYAVLEVHLPAGEVDVNVHPAKSEVRFERSNEVFAAVSRAVRLTLSEAPWVAEEFGGQGAGIGGQGAG
ncbi:MAG: DNA mismatch repair endonuclease MutL, partial [Deltaproteobacteria bacterium]|nr:DNA mismatch repair endonuclease MutL [Deltaproteobacteria bacterium]